MAALSSCFSACAGSVYLPVISRHYNHIIHNTHAAYQKGLLAPRLDYLQFTRFSLALLAICKFNLFMDAFIANYSKSLYVYWLYWRIIERSTSEIQIVVWYL